MRWSPREAVAIARRIAGRMSQEELAERLTRITGEKWTRNMVASLENGRRSFDVDLLGPISEATGVTVEFLAIGPSESNFVNPGESNWDADQGVIPFPDLELGHFALAS